MLTTILLIICVTSPVFGGNKESKHSSSSSRSRSRSSSSSKKSKSSSSEDDGNIICPFITKGTPPSGQQSVPDLYTYNQSLLTLDINDVFQDIVDLLTDSQDCWPADTLGGQTNYGGLFIRLAWHCAGTFRETDGAGGCAGGRQRFPPEASWDDNTNLDKARALLYPIKKKYGDALSWGDLFIFAGTASIYAMGGPVSQICAGRIDEPDGSASDVLGFNNDPGSAVPPCTDQGDCNEDNDIIGASTVGLIYVNPQGVNGVPDPAVSAGRVREIFSRMGNNDSQTVALIGGGHAFGKCHGACPLGAGPGPDTQPFNPWPGNCGFNFPKDTFTSGIEGQWTTYPFQWDNQYFRLLYEDGFDYILETGPGGAYQWRNPNNGLLMLTTDLAFIYDDEFYKYVKIYAQDLDALDRDFAAVWFQLVTRDGGFADNAFCIDGDELDLDLSEINPSKGGGYNNYHGKGKSYSAIRNNKVGNDYYEKQVTPKKDDNVWKLWVNPSKHMDETGYFMIVGFMAIIVTVNIIIGVLCCCKNGNYRKSGYSKHSVFDGDHDDQTEDEQEEVNAFNDQ